ncbi:NAD(P)/FAD-dependent oxidoreductase [Conexibacter woesei]|uniref:Amine oxidase n=1 Tax=Conexibacter woesei (strain DSM 14684 / CCUG 47730 / CIP 108061 / JCM 11494 / NBRC 100937 / ID131577) TaxID=469383 RepID=D3FA42_CONWI|nr:FAD-dependent oxidoreductase [Conexibacter woesei]ADB53137.1 amine oxidase [Conexibacter woesei DSM 14684]
MKIAIIGGGVSGLVAAHLLHRTGVHDVTLFERGDQLGGHAHTVEVEDERGASHAVDTGFIVHNDRNYPCFQRLLEQLGVATQPAPMSFGVADAVGDFEYNGASPNGLYAKRAHLVTPWFQRMVADLVRFNREARELLGTSAGEWDPSLREYLAARRYSDAFVERLIVPQASAVWSADPEQLWRFPARFLVEFFDNHGMLGLRDRPQWRTIDGGSRRYVEAIAARLGERRVRVATPVEAVSRHPDRVEVTPRGCAPERFDHVVIAAHADQALRLLSDPRERELELLGAFPYQRNDVVLHTDRGLLPRRRRAWASWNYHLTERATGRPTVTYHLNRLQALRGAGREYLVTLNRADDVRGEHVIERFAYDHPVYTRAGTAAQRRWEELDGVGRTSFCGAYWGWGFHEDGVRSALRACARFGGRL